MLDALELVTRRTNEKLSQEDFAKMLGITRTYLSEIERGRKKISEALEKRYNRLYPKRLVSITTRRGIECPQCHSIEAPKKLSDSKVDELDEVYQCVNCNYVFPVGESWKLHYRP